MTPHEIFQQHLTTLDVTTRAALVFRYREGLPLTHVAQLVDRPLRKLAPHLDRTVAKLREAGALGPIDAGDDPIQAGKATEDALRERLEELRGDPTLTSFSLVSAVRAEQNERGLFRRPRGV